MHVPPRRTVLQHVVNLMDALRASVKGGAPSGARRKSARGHSRAPKRRDAPLHGIARQRASRWRGPLLLTRDYHVPCGRNVIMISGAALAHGPAG